MSNFSVINRMLDSILKYESGDISPEDLEKSIETHMQALEGIGSREISESRHFTYRVVVAHLSDGEEELKDSEKVSEVLRELRAFLKSLPGSVSLNSLKGLPRDIRQPVERLR